MNPLVTIAIPFYNPGTYFQDCIKSVFAQTYQQWELILLNDGSNDGSLELAEEITDARVKVVSDDTKRGLISRLNQVPALASGEFIARMDADDIMHPQRIEKQLEILLEHNLDLVGSDAIIIDENSGIQGLRKAKGPFDSSYDYFDKSIGIHGSMLGRKAWFARNPYREGFKRAEDRELWCRTAKTVRFENLPQTLYFYRDYSAFSLHKYVKSKLTGLKIVDSHWRGNSSYFKKLKLKAKILARMIIYSIACGLNLESRLLNNRNQPLTDKDKEDYYSVLRMVRNTNIET